MPEQQEIALDTAGDTYVARPTGLERMRTQLRELLDEELLDLSPELRTYYQRAVGGMSYDECTVACSDLKAALRELEMADTRKRQALGVIGAKATPTAQR